MTGGGRVAQRDAAQHVFQHHHERQGTRRRRDERRNSLNTAQLYSPTAGTWVAATDLNARPARPHGHAPGRRPRAARRAGLNGNHRLKTAAIYNPAPAGALDGDGRYRLQASRPTPRRCSVTRNAQLYNKVARSSAATRGRQRRRRPALRRHIDLQHADRPVEPEGRPHRHGAREREHPGHRRQNVATRPWTRRCSSTSTRIGQLDLGGDDDLRALGATRPPSSPPTIVKNGQVLVSGGSTAPARSAPRSCGTEPPLGPRRRRFRRPSRATPRPCSTTTWFCSPAAPPERRRSRARFSTTRRSRSRAPRRASAPRVSASTACAATPRATADAGPATCRARSGPARRLPSATVCRAKNGSCDVAETCNGTALTCPSDAVAPLGTVCRSASGVCDVPETCDGSTKACPADGFAAATTVCRASTSPCDAARDVHRRLGHLPGGHVRAGRDGLPPGGWRLRRQRRPAAAPRRSAHPTVWRRPGRSAARPRACAT